MLTTMIPNHINKYSLTCSGSWHTRQIQKWVT